MKYDTTKVGDRVSWNGLNRTCYGTVSAETDQGLIVDVDGGGAMILSTPRSIRYAAEERKRRIEANIKKHSNLSNK